MKKLIGFAVLFNLIVSSYAAAYKYKIEVCVVPLSTVLSSTIGSVLANIAPTAQHMFVRGNVATSESTVVLEGLNFAPENPGEFLDGAAKLYVRNYPAAKCHAIVNTDNWDEYIKPYTKIVAGYNREVEHTRYGLFDQNCQVVTRRVLKSCGYEVPDGIEGILNEQPEQLISATKTFVNAIGNSLDSAGVDFRGLLSDWRF